MAWQPGQSGNPKGRPKKDKALTAVLSNAAASSLTYYDENGKKKTRRRADIIGEMVLEGVIFGKITFRKESEDDDEITLELTSNDWRNLVQWYFNRVEGLAPKGKEEEPEVDEDEQLDIRKEMEELADKRWSNVKNQLKEMQDAEEHSTTHDPATSVSN